MTDSEEDPWGDGGNTPTDPQSTAYRDATDADRWDGDLHALGARVHIPTDSVEFLVLPERYERGSGWDAHRQPPKTIEEARAALAQRIVDPAAPDSEAEAGAYERNR